MSEFNLVYHHKTIPGKKLLVRMIMLGHAKVLDPETNEVGSTSVHMLRKEYVSDPLNNTMGRKTLKNAGKTRKVRTRSKAFQEYLKGKSA